jgi:hypothetical protein
MFENDKLLSVVSVAIPIYPSIVFSSKIEIPPLVFFIDKIY